MIGAEGLDRVRPLHALHALLLSLPTTLFPAALLSDYAYSTSQQIQWSNFSSWMIAGGLVGGGFALLWAAIDLLRDPIARRGRLRTYAIVLSAMWIMGFVNALVHAKDAWAIMPEALYLSFFSAALALGAAWLGFSGFVARVGK